MSSLLVTPPFLKKGDTIAIAATARKVSPEEIHFAIQEIQKRGYNIVLASNIFESEHQFAGTDEARQKGLQELLDNPNVNAIFIARGGYGTIRILDSLDFTQFKKNPKWICGFSDVTALHSHLFQLGFKSIHSTMPLLFHQSEMAVNSLFDVLEGKKVHYPLSPHPLNREGLVKGLLVGGNLSVLYAISGSVSQIDYRNKILFIEDLDEYLYHIDRMMMHFKRSGYLSQLKGLIVGGLTEMKDNNIPFGKTAEEIIYDAVKNYDYPVCFNFPSGHIRDNYAFIHGETIKLNVQKDKVIIVSDE